MPKKKRADRNSPEYWEQALKRYGLGSNYKGRSVQTDNSDEQVIDEPVFQSVGNVMEKLREDFDGDEGFMKGHQIQKIRKREDRTIPEWVFDNSKIRILLLTVFPKLAVDRRQRKRASRWLRVIHLYYRMKLPYPVVCKELSITEIDLRNLLQRIALASQGKRANGSGSKTRDTLPTPIEETPEGTGREENAGV